MKLNARKRHTYFAINRENNELLMIYLASRISLMQSTSLGETDEDLPCVKATFDHNPTSKKIFRYIYENSFSLCN